MGKSHNIRMAKLRTKNRQIKAEKKAAQKAGCLRTQSLNTGIKYPLNQGGV